MKPSDLFCTIVSEARLIAPTIPAEFQSISDVEDLQGRFISGVRSLSARLGESTVAVMLPFGQQGTPDALPTQEEFYLIHAHDQVGDVQHVSRHHHQTTMPYQDGLDAYLSLDPAAFRLPVHTTPPDLPAAPEGSVAWLRHTLERLQPFICIRGDSALLINAGQPYRLARLFHGQVLQGAAPANPFGQGRISDWSRPAQAIWQEEVINRAILALQQHTSTSIPDSNVTSPTFKEETMLEPEAAAERDNELAEAFALAMKAKLAHARSKGRSGWDNPERCHIADLWEMMNEHARKNNLDMVDVANFAAMVWWRMEHIPGDREQLHEHLRQQTILQYFPGELS